MTCFIICSPAVVLDLLVPYQSPLFGGSLHCDGGGEVLPGAQMVSNRKAAGTVRASGQALLCFLLFLLRTGRRAKWSIYARYEQHNRLLMGASLEEDVCFQRSACVKQAVILGSDKKA